MNTKFYFLLLTAVAACVSCTTEPESSAWTVEETEIALYHSTTADADTGAMLHIEYCAAKMVRATEVIHIVYRPIDYPERNPGFAKGDKVSLSSLDEAEDFGALDTPDYWITDVEITKDEQTSNAQQVEAPDAE